MDIKSSLSIPFAKFISRQVAKAAKNPIRAQKRVLRMLINKGKSTAFGKDHGFAKINDYISFKASVPIRDYEKLKPYIDRAVDGEKDVLWPGQPLYFCKTSGTTSGTKFIPITRSSMPNHIHSARNGLLTYIAETKNAAFVQGKMIFLQGSPKLDKLESGVPYGRLSGIVANHVPPYLLKNRLPSFNTNTIDDWETKVDAIVEETKDQNMTLISGIPSWVQMYFEKLLEVTGKATIKEIFPNFSLFVYGGVNYEPYRANFERLIGKSIPSIELYPASEGFIAFQDSQKEEGMLLTVNSGIFYEFIPAEEYYEENPTRLSIGEVELDKQYAILLNTNAGLWGYDIGDTVKFVSLVPPRIKVTGRIKHFTSAFGEHVIGEEVEEAMKQTTQKFGLVVSEFHVAPQTNPVDGLPYHEWLVEGDNVHFTPEALAFMNDLMQEQNTYYKDLLEGNILDRLKVTPLPTGSFNNYMKSKGKLGGQNKVPRLANDRKIADALVDLQRAVPNN